MSATATRSTWSACTSASSSTGRALAPSSITSSAIRTTKQLGRHVRVSAADRRQSQLLRHVPRPTRATRCRRASPAAAKPPRCLPASALASLTPKELVANIDSADWGRCQEGRIVGKDKALETYEEIVRGRIDPALLEYASGNTFRGRVFPIAPKGYNRVILAYEELLPLVEGASCSIASRCPICRSTTCSSR